MQLKAIHIYWIMHKKLENYLKVLYKLQNNY